MKRILIEKRNRVFRKTIVLLVLFVFLTNAIFPVQAQSILNLPQPGTMLNVSPVFVSPFLKGMIIHPENSFQSGPVDLQE